MNLSGTVNALRILYNPSLFIPQTTISTFESLPIPLPAKVPGVPIKVVLLDKDNCFAIPHHNEVYKDYTAKWEKLRETYPGDQLLIVSNTAGSNDDAGLKLADQLKKATGVSVFNHSTKKPGCYGEIMDFVKSKGLANRPEEIAVVGDRLMTDILMANLMGASSVWIRNGVIPSKSLLTKFEQGFYDRWTMKPQSSSESEK